MLPAEKTSKPGADNVLKSNETRIRAWSFAFWTALRAPNGARTVSSHAPCQITKSRRSNDSS